MPAKASATRSATVAVVATIQVIAFTAAMTWQAPCQDDFTGRVRYAEIQQRIKDMDAERVELEAALQAKRGEEIKVLADAYAKKLQAGGFSISEGIKALAPYDTATAKRSSTAPRPPREVETGTTYKNPGTGETWKAGAKGRVVGWLQAQIDTGKRAASFAIDAG